MLTTIYEGKLPLFRAVLRRFEVLKLLVRDS